MLGFFFVYLISYFKIHQKSQNFVEFTELFVINDINSPLDNIAEIINHLPVETILTIGLVIPFYFIDFKISIKIFIINIDNKILI